MLLANAPEAVQRVDANECSVMLSAVDSALTALGSDSLRQLVKIKTSPQFTARLVRSMEMKASQEGRLLEALKEVQAKQTDTQRQLVLNAPKLLGAVESTLTLKSNTEAALGGLLKRTINIIGEINTVLNK